MDADAIRQDAAENRLFADVPEPVLDRIVPRLQAVVLEPEEVLFDEGSPASELYLVVRGALRISRTAASGQQVVLAHVSGGDVLGEMVLYHGGSRTARATAVGPTHLLRLGIEDLDAVLRLAPTEILRNLLRTSVERLQAANERRIDEMLRAERLALVGAMTDAIVHDLRNPLNVIHGVAGTLEDGDVAEPRKLAGMLDRAFESMQWLIQELLDYSRGSSRLSIRPTAVRDLLLDLEEQALRKIESGGVRVERAFLFDGLVAADGNALVRALLNVVRNAGEVLRPGGVLRLAVEEEDGTVVFTVADDGPGIPPEILPTIFEPFVTHGKRSGTGLGLATTKDIVDAHRGRIRVSSTVGQGTTFRISVPLAG
jgi:signal transduction histidine kinase